MQQVAGLPQAGPAGEDKLGMHRTNAGRGNGRNLRRRGVGGGARREG